MLNEILKNPILKEMLERDIDVRLTKDGFKVMGFYKSGHVMLTQNTDSVNKDSFISTDRYKATEIIYNFEDLVQLNHYWWKNGIERNETYFPPDDPWLSIMLELGLIKEETTVKYI
jgi:hypothetical protein